MSLTEFARRAEGNLSTIYETIIQIKIIMNPDPNFQAGIHQEIAWKNPEIQSFAVSLIEHAVALDPAAPLPGLSPNEFTTDIVPDTARGTGSGIPGSAVEILKSASLIQPVGHQHGGKFFPLRVKSTRPGRNSAFISVYHLTSLALAHEFLKRHHRPIFHNQIEMQLAAP